MAYLQIIPEDGVREDVEMAYLQIIPEDGVSKSVETASLHPLFPVLLYSISPRPD